MQGSIFSIPIYFFCPDVFTKCTDIYPDVIIQKHARKQQPTDRKETHGSVGMKQNSIYTYGNNGRTIPTVDEGP